jgi:hypothetical protein
MKGGRMSRSLLVAFVLLAVLVSGARSQQSIPNVSDERSPAAGTILGAAGFLGIFVPGTYGWGNFYAKDYVGWGILEVGGSTCTILTWMEAMRLNREKEPGEELKSEDLSAMAYIGVLGSLGFATASTIWGGLSCSSYNWKLRGKQKDMGIYLVPRKNGISLTFCKRL